MSSETQVIQVLCEVLGLEGGTEDYSADTGLLGSLPQFDSMAVVSIITRLEEELDIIVDDDDIDADVFESIGSLVGFVDMKLAS